MTFISKSVISITYIYIFDICVYVCMYIYLQAYAYIPSLPLPTTCYTGYNIVLSSQFKLYAISTSSLAKFVS